MPDSRWRIASAFLESRTMIEERSSAARRRCGRMASALAMLASGDHFRHQRTCAGRLVRQTLAAIELRLAARSFTFQIRHRVCLFLTFIFCAGPGQAQRPCRSTPVYQPCDIDFEMTEQEASQHPNPYATVELRAEFRGPKGDTYRLPGFWDGGRKFKIRFAPLAEGRWDFRVTSNIERFTGKIESFTATPAVTPGFVYTFNVHHFRYSQPNTGHYWLGDTCYPLAILPPDEFQRLVDARAGQKFNHLRGLLLGDEANAKRAIPTPDQVSPEFFQGLDERVRYMNQKGLTFDVTLAPNAAQLEKLLPNWRQRERFFRYLVARYSAMNITWQGFQTFEDDPESPALLKEFGDLLKQLDIYHHPRSTGAASTSGSLASSGWMDYVTSQTSDPDVFAVEYQLYAAPFVNTGAGAAGRGAAPAQIKVDVDAVRRRMWNAAINGQHLTLDTSALNGGAAEAAATQAQHLRDFFAQTRYFDLEPYFGIEGARALALEEVEYVVFLERPPSSENPVELTVPKSGYDVSWFNPITGEWVKEHEFKGDRFKVGGPPDPSHDWVLYVRKEGKKQGMMRSYKLESRTPVMQELQVNRNEVPFTIQLPSDSALPPGVPLEFNATLTRPGPATRNMIWMWTGEASSSGFGYRVLGTKQFGEFIVPANIAREYPTALLVRVFGLDGNGKLYAADKVYTLKK
ncbi:MAG TPA: DUF5060 domain-containing protein [Bryobacterales bacterium]|nr:DUF5060 domain-containing protein [Bryobacterales bacterium]